MNTQVALGKTQDPASCVSSAEAGVAGHWYAVYVLLILFLTNALNHIDRAIVGILAMPIKADMQLTDTQIGLLTGLAFVLCYSLCGLPIAQWADKGVRRSILALGVAVWSAMTALCGAAKTFPLLVAARIGVGVGEAACAPTALPLISDYFAGERRVRAIAIFQSALFVGVVAGTVLVAWIAETHGWRAAFFALGLPGLALALIIRFTIREPERGALDHEQFTATPTPDSLRRRLAVVFRTPGFTPLFIGMALMAMVSSTLGAWGPSFFMRTHGLSIAQVGVTLGPAIGVGGVLGAVGGGYLITWLTRRRRDIPWAMLAPALGALLAAPVLLVYLFVESVAIALASAALATLLNSIYMGPIMAAALGLHSSSIRALTSAILVIGQNLIGHGLGPLGVGLVSDALAMRGFGEQALQFALLGAPLAGVLGAIVLLAGARRWGGRVGV